MKVTPVTPATIAANIRAKQILPREEVIDNLWMATPAEQARRASAKWQKLAATWQRPNHPRSTGKTARERANGGKLRYEQRKVDRRGRDRAATAASKSVAGRR